MSDYRETARNMLEVDEGVRLKPYCDKCGREWRECERDRLQFLMETDFNEERMPAKFSIPRACTEHDICPGGKITIAMGRNLENRPLTSIEVGAFAASDMAANEIAACDFIGEEYFFKLSPDRRAVLICLAHWGGLGGAKNFRIYILQALHSLAECDCEGFHRQAAEELLWKDGRDHSLGRSGWWNISQPRIERYAAIWRGEAPK